jgi:hypothetical protein
MGVETFVYILTHGDAMFAYCFVSTLVLVIGWRMLCWGLSLRRYGNIWDKPSNPTE